jgi:hypothetical protein
MRTDAVPNSMHGHADCLSVIAWLAGTRVLVDSGLYSYNAGGAWEAHFRETAAHNTARIDGRDQARHIGKMAWSNSYRAAPEGWRDEQRHMWVAGSHDGYARGANGVLHRRTVWLRPGAWLVILDDFPGSGAHVYEVNYQFAPGTLQDLGGRARFNACVDVGWSGTGEWTPALANGGDGPADGWIAPSLGIRVPAPRLTLRHKGEGDVGLMTVFAATRESRVAAAPVTMRQDAGGMLVAVPAGDHIDAILVPDGSAARGAVRSDATLVSCRIPIDPARPIEQDRLGGTRLDVDGAALRHLVARLAASDPTP